MKHLLMALSILLGLFVLDVSATSSGPSIRFTGPPAAEAAACPSGQVPDENGACCPPASLTGAPDGGSICPGSVGTPTGVFGAKILKAITFGGAAPSWHDPTGVNEDDPGLSFSSSHVGAVSVGGAPIGGVTFGPASTTRTLGADGDGHVRLPLFASSGDPTQRLSLGAYFDYLRADTDYYDGAPLGTHVRQDRFEGGGTLHYTVGGLYADGQIGAVGGRGRITYADASMGTFDSLGYKGQVVAGKIFTLYDARVFAPAQRGAPSRIIDGTDVTLDLAGRFTFGNETVGGFADTSGFQRGAERLNEDGLGVRLRLAADVYTNGAIVTPHVAVTLDQLVAFSHDLYVPTQASVATGGLESFSSPGRTLFGVNAGVSVLDTSGVRYGVEGYYSAAREINAGGGRIYVRLPVRRWLGLSG